MIGNKKLLYNAFTDTDQSAGFNPTAEIGRRRLSIGIPILKGAVIGCTGMRRTWLMGVERAFTESYEFARY